MTENNKISVPWSAIARNPDHYLDPQYLPANVIIIEVSKMQSGPLHQCLQFWIKKQESGNIPFRFKAVLESDIRHANGKRKRDDNQYDDASMDRENSDKTMKDVVKDQGPDIASGKRTQHDNQGNGANVDERSSDKSLKGIVTDDDPDIDRCGMAELNRWNRLIIN